MIRSKAQTATLLCLSISLSACSEGIVTKHIGDATLCIPESFIFDRSPYVDKNSPFYTDNPFLKGSRIEKDIPGYLDGLVKSKEQLVLQPQVYVSNYDNAQISIANADEYDPDFFKEYPSLEGYKSEGESRFLFFWNIFATQPEQSKTFWGECVHKHFNPDAPIECRRHLRIDNLQLNYPIAKTNIDLYPKVDTYLKQKVSEWRCEPDG